MSDQRPEIARLSFSGQHYDEGVVDATVLKELLCFQNILTETAKSVWKRQNPERKRLSKDFDDRTRFVLRNIKDGSVVIPLEMLRRSNQMDLFGDTDDVIKKAVELIYNSFIAANCNKPLPSDIPRELLLSLSEFGERLSDNA